MTMYEVPDVDYLKKKRFTESTLFFYGNVPSLKKYIDNVTVNKNKIYFNIVKNTTIVTEGFWLLETDNQDYYKISYFENK